MACQSLLLLEVQGEADKSERSRPTARYNEWAAGRGFRLFSRSVSVIQARNRLRVTGQPTACRLTRTTVHVKEFTPSDVVRE